MSDSPRSTYSKGALEGNLVLLDTLNGLRWNGGLAILEYRCYVDGFPRNWSLKWYPLVFKCGLVE